MALRAPAGTAAACWPDRATGRNAIGTTKRPERRPDRALREGPAARQRLKIEAPLGVPVSSPSLRPGDVIYAVNGVSVRGLAELRSAVARPQPGEPLVLHVERSGRLVYVVVETE